MSDDTDDIKKSRQNAFARRLEEQTDKASEPDETEETEQEDKTDKTDSMEETEQADQTEGEKKTEKTDKDSSRPSTKDKKALTMYLTEEQIAHLDAKFTRLKIDYQEEFGKMLQKNADFYPAALTAAFEDRTTRDVLWARTED